MRSLLCLLLAVPCLIPAQAPQPVAQTPEATLRSNSSEVLLDFVVRDKHAKIIRDLRPDEVQVFEDGVPQRQRYFQFVDGHVTVQTSPQPAQAAPTAAARPAATTS